MYCELCGYWLHAALVKNNKKKKSLFSISKEQIHDMMRFGQAAEWMSQQHASKGML